MSGQDDKNGWGLASLKVYFEQRFSDLKAYFEQRFTDNDRRVEAAFLAAEKAIQKAEIATEKRLEGMNELREQITSERNLFVTREMHDQALAQILERSDGRMAELIAKHEESTRRLTVLESTELGSTKTTFDRRAQGAMTFGWIYALGTIITAVVAIVAVIISLSAHP
jgi:hypothetical protein